MGLNDSLEEKKFDVRLQKHNLKTGALREEDIKKHLERLPDDSPKAESVKFFDSNAPKNDDDIH